MYPDTSIARNDAITERCVDLPTPVAPNDVPSPSDTDIEPIRSPNTPALRSPTERSFVVTTAIALEANCRKSTSSCVAPTRPPPTVPTIQQNNVRRGAISTMARTRGARANDQAAALKELGVEKAAVLGVSQGGMIALAMALDHPGLVEKLVLAVSAPRANPLIRERVGRWIELAEAGDHKPLMIDTVENSYSPERLKKLRRAYHLIGSISKPKDYRRFLINAHSILAFDAFDRLGTVACPTLILAGEDDKIVGVEASREMRQRIPNSTLHVYPGLGHAAYEEAADFYERVFRFLKQN